MKTRKHYPPAFKAQLVQELLREEKAVSQLATEHGIHPNQLSTWKRTAMEGMPTLFSRSDGTAALKATHERQLEDLYAQIGRLTTQVAWLKRKSGLDFGQGCAGGPGGAGARGTDPGRPKRLA